MSIAQLPPNTRPSKHSEVVVGQARALEADAGFTHAPGTSVAMFVAMALLLVAGIAAAGWAIVRLIAHA